jgi:hypothetical protein
MALLGWPGGVSAAVAAACARFLVAPAVTTHAVTPAW